MLLVAFWWSVPVIKQRFWWTPQSNTPTNLWSATFRDNPMIWQGVSVYMDDLQPRKTFENLIALKDKSSSTITDGTVHAL